MWVENTKSFLYRTIVRRNVCLSDATLYAILRMVDEHRSIQQKKNQT